MSIRIFTDGSSRGNPGPGGWGSVLCLPERIKEMGGREEKTTNNRMELMAIREAFRFLEKEGYTEEIEIYTDSAYAMQGLIGWMYTWEKNGWKTKGGEDVLNQDLWKDLLGYMFRFKHKTDVSIHKVAGHAGVPLNERVDAIATGYADNERVLLFSGSLANYKKLLGKDILSLRASTSSSTKTSKGKAYAYVSLVDGVVHRDKTWAACEKRVKGKAGARYKKVFSQEEEEELVSSWRS